jgi:hypothetical protein
MAAHKLWAEKLKEPWLKRAGAGVEGGGDLSILPGCNGEKWAIIKVPGRRYFVGMYMERGYAPVEYRLLRKGDSMLDAKVLWKGRLTKEGKKTLVQSLDLAEAVGRPYDR